MDTQEIKYRVFDAKGNFQQSYSNKLKGGYSWARDCAKRVNGYIVEVTASSSDKIILDLRQK